MHHQSYKVTCKDNRTQKEYTHEFVTCFFENYYIVVARDMNAPSGRHLEQLSDEELVALQGILNMLPNHYQNVQIGTDNIYTLCKDDILNRASKVTKSIRVINIHIGEVKNWYKL